MNNESMNALDRVHRDIDKLRAVEEALFPGATRPDEEALTGLYHIVEEVRADLEDASEHLTATDHPPNGGEARE